MSDVFNIGAIKMRIETAFLLELDSDRIYNNIKHKINNHKLLNDEEIMQLIILPLSYHKREDKEHKIEETLKLATKLQNKEQQIFALSGILTFTDKIINIETANNIRKVIEMTKVAMIFEQEKQEAVSQAIEDTVKNVIIKMIENGYSTEEILSLVEGFSKDNVEKLRSEL